MKLHDIAIFHMLYPMFKQTPPEMIEITQKIHPVGVLRTSRIGRSFEQYTAKFLASPRCEAGHFHGAIMKNQWSDLLTYNIL